MKGKMNLGMKMMMFFMLVMLLGTTGLYGAEVDRAEFNREWQETYNELKEISPEAAEEFKNLTVQEFKEGTIAYEKSDAEAKTSDREAKTSEDKGRGDRGRASEVRGSEAPTRGPRGGREGEGFDRPLIGGQTYGAGYEGGYGPRLEDSTLAELGFSKKEIKKLRNVEQDLAREADKVEWNKLSPEQRRTKELELEKTFQEAVGRSPQDVYGLGDPQGIDGPHPGHGGPPNEGIMPIGGPGSDFTHYGPITPGSGPRFAPGDPAAGDWVDPGSYSGPMGPAPYYGPAPKGGEYYGPGPIDPYGPAPIMGGEYYGPAPMEGPAPMDMPYAPMGGEYYGPAPDMGYAPPMGTEHVGPGFEGDFVPPPGGFYEGPAPMEFMPPPSGTPIMDFEYTGPMGPDAPMDFEYMGPMGPDAPMDFEYMGPMGPDAPMDFEYMGPMDGPMDFEAPMEEPYIEFEAPMGDEHFEYDGPPEHEFEPPPVYEGEPPDPVYE